MSVISITKRMKPPIKVPHCLILTHLFQFPIFSSDWKSSKGAIILAAYSFLNQHTISLWVSSFLQNTMNAVILGPHPMRFYWSKFNQISSILFTDTDFVLPSHGFWLPLILSSKSLLYSLDLTRFDFIWRPNLVIWSLSGKPWPVWVHTWEQNKLTTSLWFLYHIFSRLSPRNSSDVSRRTRLPLLEFMPYLGKQSDLIFFSSFLYIVPTFSFLYAIYVLNASAGCSYLSLWI